MKGLFIIFEALSEASGISKKIIAQVNSFKYNGVEMELSNLKVDDSSRYIGRLVGDNYIEKFPTDWFGSRIAWRARFSNLLGYIVTNNIDFVYIRYLHFANPFFINFLKRLKLSGVKIIMEVPTFPYDQEYVGNSLSKIIERASRKRFKYYVDRIVSFSNYETIFDVPTIRISNGIDINNIKLVSGEHNKIPGVVNMIGVAALSFWHGYDRVIEGLKDYYSNGQPNTTVIFNIVADVNMPETIKCKELVAQYNLERYVLFHGKKFGEELDAVFETADIGVGSLGRHRTGIKYIKPIKNREYCARGIPFFYSEIDGDFEDADFILKVPADETHLKVDEVVQFLTDNEFEPGQIRSYAADTLTWNKQMSKVIPYIQ